MIGYINSVVFVKEEIDNILRNVYAWARVYVYDIICGAKSLPDFFKKLRILFSDIFLKYNISIKLSKFFLNYFDVGLLGQKINFLGLTTFEEKFRAINLCNNFEIFGALDYYLGLTGYLRNYIYYYAQLAALL